MPRLHALLFVFFFKVSLEEVDLRVKLRTGSPEEQIAAEKLLPLVRIERANFERVQCLVSVSFTPQCVQLQLHVFMEGIEMKRNR